MEISTTVDVTFDTAAELRIALPFLTTYCQDKNIGIRVDYEFDSVMLETDDPGEAILLIDALHDWDTYPDDTEVEGASQNT